MSDSPSSKKDDGTQEGAIAKTYGPIVEFSKPTKILQPQAWHRPRKQWVREEQWLASIAASIKAGEISNSKILKYLTLPGADLLDVRMLGKLCKEHSYTLRILGFNDGGAGDGDPFDASETLAPLWLDGIVSRDSYLYSDKFQSLANPKSFGRQTLNQVGTMDVINLDLCNSIAAYQNSGADPTHYNAIHELFDFQRRNRTDPFLVFITTRVDSRKVDPAAFRKLTKLVRKNCADARFESTLQSAFALGKHKMIGYDEQCRIPSAVDFSRTMLVGLSKWLIGLLLSSSPKWKISLLSAAEYSLYARGGKEMVSLAYRCEMIKTEASDATKLSTKNVVPHDEISEALLAIDIVNAAKQIFDLDALISENGLYEDLALKAAVVMEQAGYQKESFLRWCFDQASHPLLDIPKRT